MKTLNSFLDQAVNGAFSFETLLTLLGIASDPNCHRVRYLQPPPQDFGEFIAPPADFKKFDYREMIMRQPEELTLNQLCAGAHVVVKKIADYHNAKVEAETRAVNAEHRANRAEEETKHVTALLQEYAPHLFTYHLDEDGYLP